MLVTIGGAVRTPGVHEIEIGTPIREVLALGGGPTDDVAGRARGGLFRHLAANRRPIGRPVLGRRAPADRGVGRRRNHRGAAARRLRAGGDGAGGALPRPRERGAVRPVRLRAAGTRGRLGRARRGAGRGRGLREMQELPSEIERPGRLRPPRRRGPPRAERPGGVPRRGAAAPPGAVLGGRSRARSCRSPPPPANGAEMTAHLRVNPIACDGHGNCHELLPELIAMDRWGYPIIDGRAVPPRSSATPAARSRCARSSPSPWSDGRRAERGAGAPGGRSAANPPLSWRSHRPNLVSMSRGRGPREGGES